MKYYKAIWIISYEEYYIQYLYVAARSESSKEITKVVGIRFNGQYVFTEQYVRGFDFFNDKVNWKFEEITEDEFFINII